MYSRCSISLVVASLLLAPLRADDLYAFTTTDLLRLDPGTGAVIEVLGPLAFPASVDFVLEAAYHRGRGSLFLLTASVINGLDRDFHLYEVDPATGRATFVGFLMNSVLVGHAESLEYVDSLGSLVLSHTDGGPNDFTSDTYELVSAQDASLTFLTTSNQDTDNATYDAANDRYYSLDANDADWVIVDLTTGAATPAGAAIDGASDPAFDRATPRIFGHDIFTGEFLRFDLSSGGLAVGPAVVVGMPAIGPLWALTFGPDRTPIGATVCSPGVANSTGNAGTIGAFGSALIASDDVALHAENLPLNATTYFLTSLNAAVVNMPGGSQGRLCLGGSIGRYVGPGQVLNSGARGVASLRIDLSAHPQPNGLIQVQSGQTWFFQAWHRDANPTATSNFTDAVALTLQ